MLRKTVFLLFLICISYQQSYSEIKNIGTPFIRNFTKHDYKAATQNWAVAQDKKGFMYFANNEGLLVYDGVQWQLYQMPNSSMVRSIFIDDRGVIFVGAYNDFGMMVPDKNGKLTFRSLKDKIKPENRNFDDVWNIFPFKNKIIFQAYNDAFILNEDETFSVIKAPSRFPTSFRVSGRLFFCDTERGLLEYDGRELKQLKGCEALLGEEINGILPYNGDNEILICTLNNGLYVYNGISLREWSVPANETLKKFQIFCATSLNEHNYAIGTIQNGLLIIDDQGRLIQHINQKKGLQNNTILKIFTDRSGNLWLALDNGIDYVNVNSPIYFIRQADGFGAGYASIIHNGKLYLGTNQGLFVKDWNAEFNDNDFRLIPGTTGQVWSLSVINNVLLCGHNSGTLVVEGETARLINDIPGGWKYLGLKKYPGYMIGGTFSGIILFKWQNNRWNFVSRVKGFNESFRVFEEDDDGNIWMSHGFKGVYKVRIDPETAEVTSSRFYTSADGLPTNYNLNVFKIKGKVFVTSLKQGMFEYVQGEDRFIPSSYFNQILSPLKGTSYLKEDVKGNIWFVSGNALGVFRPQEDLSLKYLAAPFTLLTGKFINGFESVYFYSDEDIFIGIENGFAHYSQRANYKSYPDFSAFITKATVLPPDSTFYHGRPALMKTSDSGRKYSFPFKNNGFRFTFTSPVYDNPENIEYSYMMEGLSDQWSEWSNSYSHDFSHIPDGHYKFIVKARNQLGIESLSDFLEITVLPPWYRSLLAYLLYLIAGISAVLFMLWAVKRKVDISRRKERIKQLKAYKAKEQEYIRNALQSEKEIISMKNERLHLEMIQRDKELANQAMNLIRKNEFLGKIRSDLHNLKKSSRDENVNEKIVSVISKINRDIDHNKQREVFETAFDEVHEEFLNKLKAKYPALTPSELRMCAYLKMNISTKEIAPLMNISDRGVEICRYRIRKKLKLDRSTNLTSFLLNACNNNGV